MANPEEIMNVRTPSLDLDCLYGSGPDLSSELFETDKVHLKVGKTLATTKLELFNADSARREVT
ncbi:MAG: hypothetical protein QNJ54_37160 [Prochloraceae cyanobacterium]|nr:hypothetical protein [Prochloraceae cyanobacterium]